MTNKKNFKGTRIGCFVGIFSQAIITNLAAILFVPMMDLYSFDYKQLGFLIAINFIAQVSADISFSKVIDKISYRKITLPTCIVAFLGILLFALTPYIFKKHLFLGFMLATVIFAFSSGLLEIILSPITSAITEEDKGPAVSLMHSFYAFGQIITIVITTLFLYIFGNASWPIITAFWSLVPLIAFIIFYFSSMPDIPKEDHRQHMKDVLFKPFYIICLLAIFAGAGAEVIMNQWSSTFMEKALNLPKAFGDIFGMCGFALTLGLGRFLYGIYGSKLNINKLLVTGSLLSVICYLIVGFSTNNIITLVACTICGFATSLLWPGTIVVASSKYPLAGAWLFAFLAAAGDIGASVSSFITGEVIDFFETNTLALQFANFLSISAEQASIRGGIILAAVFPVIGVICHVYLKRKCKVTKIIKNA